jgi:hypothetical protein
MLSARRNLVGRLSGVELRAARPGSRAPARMRARIHRSRYRARLGVFSGASSQGSATLAGHGRGERQSAAVMCRRHPLPASTLALSYADLFTRDRGVIFRSICDSRHRPRASLELPPPTRPSGQNPTGRFQMSKTLFGVSVGALIIAFVAGWAIPQSKARVAPRASVQVDAFEMMTTGKQMSSEHFADYSFVFN